TRGGFVKRLFAPILMAALVGGVVAGGAIVLLGGTDRTTTTRTASPPTSSTSRSTGARRDVSSTALTATQIYQRDSKGVVLVKAVTTDGEDEGTGIVLNEKGLILTNDHVIADATSITVEATGSTRTVRAAKVVGEEANEDLALISVNPSGLELKPLTFMSSSSLEVGEGVYAIGNPYGLEETLTRGIISALDREIEAPDGSKISDAIQTDAALNPGNSGGPLINDEGKVIGVNSQIATDQSTSDDSQPGSTGVGFAISSNTVVDAAKKIEAGNGVSSASVEGSAARPGQGSGSADATEAEALRRAYEAGGEGEPGSTGTERTEGTEGYGAAGPYGSESPRSEGTEGGVVVVP
ncbi:MAG: S1C family serine protease, partial [Nitrososphaerales archaeon]